MAGAGLYRANQRLGAMHGKRFLVRELYYGTDGASFFLRVDFLPEEQARLTGLEARLTLESGSTTRLTLCLTPGGAEVAEFTAGDGEEPSEALDQRQLEIQLGRILEMRVPLEAIRHRANKVRFQFSLWLEGLPVDALPVEGWIELDTTEPGDWTV